MNIFLINSEDKVSDAPKLSGNDYLYRLLKDHAVQLKILLYVIDPSIQFSNELL
jgi:hypothetical protein